MTVIIDGRWLGKRPFLRWWTTISKSLADVSSGENSLDCAVVGINLKGTFRIAKCGYLLGFIYSIYILYKDSK